MTRPRLAPVLVATAVLVAVGSVAPAALATTPSAAAGSTTPVSAVSVAPSPTSLGSTSTVSVSAANRGRTALSRVAVGVTTPLAGGMITRPANGTCRVTSAPGKRLYYCLVSSLAAGQTATFTFRVTPAAVGTYGFDAYARDISTMLQTTSATRLTVR